MNKLIIIIGVLFFAGCKEPGNKYFTGNVEYAYSYASDSLNADSLTKVRPAKGLFRYDTLNYQSQFIAGDTNTNYYSGLLNKCLSQTNHLGNYECLDYGAFTDSIISYKIIDTDEKILGYSCKILEVQKKNSWLQYYFADDLKIAPLTYNKHASYNWDFYGEKANGGLILKSEHRLKYFTLKGIATSLIRHADNFKALEIDEKLFSQFCK
jgi:hypothetical protein